MIYVYIFLTGESLTSSCFSSSFLKSTLNFSKSSPTKAPSTFKSSTTYSTSSVEEGVTLARGGEGESEFWSFLRALRAALRSLLDFFLEPIGEVGMWREGGWGGGGEGG